MRFLKVAGLVAWAIWSPSVVFAQSSAGGGTIEGVATDMSGAALADVAVEATSAALIERSRKTVTNSVGRYSITGLRPGSYTVTFALDRFSTVRREGVDVNATGVVDVSAGMKTGDITETVTVTSRPPLVDARTSTRQLALTQEILDSLPFPRSPVTLAAVLPGVTCTTRDVGGLAFTFSQTCAAHGGSGGDQRITMDGMNLGVIQTPESSNFIPNTEATQEIVIETAGSGAVWQTSGVKTSFIPRDGGNTLRGSLFATAAFGRMQSRNLSHDLVEQGATVADALDRTMDVNPVVGGPILADRLWFSASVRAQAIQILTNQYFNRNAFLPDEWTYDADTSRQARSRDVRWTDIYGRLTWGVNARNRIAVIFSDQDKCECLGGVSASRTPEAAYNDRNPLQRSIQLEWRSPWSHRLMFEFVGQKRDIEQGLMPLTEDTSGVGADLFRNYDQMIGVVIANGGGVLQNNFNFHGPGPAPQDPTAGGPFTLARRPSYAYNAAVTYVTGVHTFNLGVQDTFGYFTIARYTTTFDQWGRQVRYGFERPYVPQSVTAYTPSFTRNDLDHDMGIYAQDKWLLNRLTLSLGGRLDWLKTSYPAQRLPATSYGRPSATFRPGKSLDWKDLSTRLGVAFDLTGRAKTVLKFGLNKYVQSQGLSGIGVSGNPLSNGRGITNTITRAWRDLNNDYIVDCDLYETQSQGECTNAISSGPFNTTPTVLSDAAARYGWGLRPNNWELTLGLQHELWRGALLDVAYYGRWFGNRSVVDDTACVDPVARTGCREPRNNTSYGIATPVDARLPGGGGQMLWGFLEPDCSSAAANCGDATAVQIATLPPSNQIVRLEDVGVKQIERWSGVDVSLGTHRNGLFLLGGVSTGRRYGNECEVWTLFPEVQGSGRPFSFCEVHEPFRTSFKGLAAYTLPRPSATPGWLGTVLQDIRLAAIVQSIPGNEMSANYNMTNAEFARRCPSLEVNGDTSCSTLGRPLTNLNRSTDTRNVALIPPATLYDERHNQVDLRIGKGLSSGRTAITVNLDVFNAFNANPVLERNNTLGQSATPGAYATAQQQQADGGYNSLWVPTSVLMPRVAKFSLTFDF